LHPYQRLHICQMEYFLLARWPYLVLLLGCYRVT
jgi:hypothetical protein